MWRVSPPHICGGRGSVGVLRGTGGEWLEHLEAGFMRGLAAEEPAGELVVVSGPHGPLELSKHDVTVFLYTADRTEETIIADARSGGLKLVVTSTELLSRYPDVVVAAIQVDVAEAMVRLAREAHDGAIQGRPYTFDLGSGVVDVILNPNLPAAEYGELHEAFGIAKSEVTAGIVELEKLGM